MGMNVAGGDNCQRLKIGKMQESQSRRPERGVCFAILKNAKTALSPAKLFERQTRIPDLGHVRDLVALKLHDVDVVGLGGLAGGWTGTVRQVCASESGIGAYIVSF
jgi:hypothetical protein